MVVFAAWFVGSGGVWWRLIWEIVLEAAAFDLGTVAASVARHWSWAVAHHHWQQCLIWRWQCMGRSIGVNAVSNPVTLVASDVV